VNCSKRVGNQGCQCFEAAKVQTGLLGKCVLCPTFRFLLANTRAQEKQAAI
jgi:hypothetical protein